MIEVFLTASGNFFACYQIGRDGKLSIKDYPDARDQINQFRKYKPRAQAPIRAGLFFIADLLEENTFSWMQQEVLIKTHNKPLIPIINGEERIHEKGSLAYAYDRMMERRKLLKSLTAVLIEKEDNPTYRRFEEYGEAVSGRK
jgi:hypothetical protein